MIETSEAYKAAVIAPGRRSKPRAIVDITDPDIVFGEPTGNAFTALSEPDEIINHVFELGKPYATLETNRWLLDGTFAIDEVNGEVGVESEGLMDDNGEGSEWIELPFSGVDILQNLSVYFSDRQCDGIPEELTIDVVSGGVPVYTEIITGNTSRTITLGGFSAYAPTGILVTVTKWSLPYRRIRWVEIIAGIYEIWGSDDIAGFEIEMQTAFNLLSVPYSTCRLGLENISRRFDPRNKDGIFLSLEDRQPIQTFIGIETENGFEYVPTGTYYQYDEGWKTQKNATTMVWYLVDIIGLLQKKRYKIPETFPTTFSGWIESVISHLGPSFVGHYRVPTGYESTSVRVSGSSASMLNDKTCGDVLMWLCQVTKLFMRSDPRDGYLVFEEYRDGGNDLTLDNLSQYPAMSANSDISELYFKIGSSEYNFSGTSTNSATTATIENPFIANADAAMPVAQYVVSAFGGNMIETIGRGDPSSEIGDAITVQLDKSSATTGRLCYQLIKFVDGVMRNCKSKMLQSSGLMLYTNRVQIKESCNWTVPEGVTSIRLVLVGKGQDGERGESGDPAPVPSSSDYDAAGTAVTFGSPGSRGADGHGGRVWTGIVSVSAGGTYIITVGDETTFSVYSSENGVIYEKGLKDVASGDSFARPGVSDPVAGSGDGGRGGSGGSGGKKVYRRGVLISETAPGSGGFGARGASGSCVIYWENPEE